MLVRRVDVVGSMVGRAAPPTLATQGHPTDLLSRAYGADDGVVVPRTHRRAWVRRLGRAVRGAEVMEPV